MKQIHRLPSYTLMEIVIAMSLTAIVIGITYTAWTIVFRAHLGFKKKNESVAALQRLDGLLQRDFGRATHISYIDSVMALQDSSAMLSYEFKNNRVIRHSISIDTFNCKFSQVSVSFEGHLPVDNTTIDDLFFEVTAEDQKIPYHYHKIYSSAELISTYAGH